MWCAVGVATHGDLRCPFYLSSVSWRLVVPEYHETSLENLRGGTFFFCLSPPGVRLLLYAICCWQTAQSHLAREGR